jgi:hypothetical protein
MEPIEIINITDTYKIGDLYYSPAIFEGRTVELAAKRDDPAWSSETADRILAMIDEAIAAGSLTEEAMIARGAAVTEQKAAEEARRIAEHEASLTYAEQRFRAYGSVFQQLDMLYWDMATGSSTWQDHIAAIKARFPKPA